MSNYLMGQSSLLATPLSRNEIGDLGYVVGSAGSISAVAEVWKNTFAEINPVAKIVSDMVASHSFLPKYVPDFSGILKITECVPDFSGIVKMPELMSGFSEILKVSDFVSESMISVMKCSGIMAYQQGLLKEQLSILTANNVLPDMSKLMDRIYQTNKIITRDLQTKIEELQLVDDGSIASQDEYHEESNLEEISVPEEISIEDDDDGCLEQHSLLEIEDLLQMCQVSIDLQRRILSELQKKRTDWNLITSVMNLLLMVIQTVKAFF